MYHTEIAKTVVCPKCSHENPLGTKFYGNCGVSFAEYVESDPDIKLLQKALKGRYVTQKSLGKREASKIFCKRKHSPERAIELWKGILLVLAEIHTKGIIHRDIKLRTGTCTTIGTVTYVSPEQLAGKFIDSRYDLYSTGILLYKPTKTL